MNIKEVNSVNKYFIKIANDLIDGKVKSPRGLETLEIEDAIMILNDINNSVCTLPARKLSLKYLNAEFKWYNSGDKNIKFIDQFSTMWKGICDDKNEVNSNYGHFIFKQQDKDGNNQFEWCYQKLINDGDSRQAIINYNQPIHKYNGVKDFVCAVIQQFRINDNKLDSRVVMRSNDLIYGFSYDVPWFTNIQQQLADRLNIKPGKYIHNAMSLHVYKKHFNMLEEIARSHE